MRRSNHGWWCCPVADSPPYIRAGLRLIGVGETGHGVSSPSQKWRLGAAHSSFAKKARDAATVILAC